MSEEMHSQPVHVNILREDSSQMAHTWQLFGGCDSPSGRACGEEGLIMLGLFLVERKGLDTDGTWSPPLSDKSYRKGVS